MSDSARWPVGLEPESVPVFTHNELRTDVSVESMWNVLTLVTEWPSWYPNAANVRTADGETRLKLGSAFRWKTLGVTVSTTVVEFEPMRALAWTASGPGTRGFHRWDFSPEQDGSCLVSTDEVETGVVARLIAGRLKRDLLRAHQAWLEALLTKARAAG